MYRRNKANYINEANYTRHMTECFRYKFENIKHKNVVYHSRLKSTILECSTFVNIGSEGGRLCEFYFLFEKSNRR